MELSREYYTVIIEARDAMPRTVAQMAPDDPTTARQLMTVALVGMFTDTIAGSTGRRDIVTIVNQQLANVGLWLVETPRQ
jgi:hypothetical protein